MMHEDERRVLTSIPYLGGEIKIITAKKDCELGHHYHKIKKEEFMLAKGSAKIAMDGKVNDMVHGEKIIVHPGKIHSFEIKKDSVLICFCSKPYDKTDDYIE